MPTHPLSPSPPRNSCKQTCRPPSTPETRLEALGLLLQLRRVLLLHLPLRVPQVLLRQIYQSQITQFQIRSFLKISIKLIKLMSCRKFNELIIMNPLALPPHVVLAQVVHRALLLRLHRRARRRPRPTRRRQQQRPPRRFREWHYPTIYRH